MRPKLFDKFRHRSYELERLDTGDYTAAEYSKWRREMRFIHRAFGEVRAFQRSLHREIVMSGSETISILDVGAGSGDILREMRKWRNIGDPLLVGVELDESAARSISSNSIYAVRCDALKLPFSAASFDYVISSLFLHHLSDEVAATLLGELQRVARKRIFVIDLHRSPVAYYFYKCFAKMFLQPFTRDDGALSILRSFKPDELHALAERAGLKNIRVERSASYRLILSAN